jgi:hypothetical protein
MVEPGILHIVTTACATSPGVVFEKLHRETAPCTWHFKNIARLPKRGILSWAHCFSCDFILPIAYSLPSGFFFDMIGSEVYK